jgi:hypothetical protein
MDACYVKCVDISIGYTARIANEIVCCGLHQMSSSGKTPDHNERVLQLREKELEIRERELAVRELELRANMSTGPRTYTFSRRHYRRKESTNRKT